MSLLDTASLVITPNGTKASTLYSIVPSDGSGDMTVTRATTATRVNSAGLIESVASNVPRLDYTNGTCPSILVEPQRTNVVLYNQEFNNGYWVVSPGTFITANSVNSPDGTLNADKLSETTFNGVHQIYSGVISTTALASNTYSVFAKKGERIWIRLQNGSTGAGNFNLNNGTIGTVSAGTTAKIEDYGDGWYRCQITFTASGLTDRFYVRLMTADNVTSYLGDGTSGVYLFGAQSEVGSYATSYIPTTSASVTRNADVISKTGISSLIGQTEGTLFLDFVFKTPPLDICGPIGISSADNTNRIGFWNNYTFNSIAIFLRANGSNLFNTSVSSLVDGTRYKLAVSYKSGDIRVYLNGTLTNTFTNTFTFSNDISVLYNASYESTSNVHQRTNQITLWKTALTNTQLAQLTTI